MLYLNPNKEKILTFEVEVSGANPDQVNGFVRFFLSDNVQLGFPAIVQEGQIQAVIAPLKDLVKTPVKNGTVFEAQLDLYTEENDYFSPWSGEIEVKMPVRVEAKIVSEDEGGTRGRSSRPTIRAKVRTEEKVTRKPRMQPITERTQVSKSGWTKEKLQNITEAQIYKYIERAGTKNKTIQDIIFNESVAAAAEAGDKGNVGILKHVVKALKKPK